MEHDQIPPIRGLYIIARSPRSSTPHLELRSAMPSGAALDSTADAFGGNISPVPKDRRNGSSDLKRAAEALEHAIQFLVTEAIDGRRSADLSHTDAIVLLCQALNGIARVERRASNRISIATWLRHAALFWNVRPPRP